MDQRLINDSEFIIRLNLSELRLMKDGELDWFMLIPLREDKKDWIDLTLEDQYELTREIDYVSHKIKSHCNPDKINVANLGNVVSQLHIHIIARYQHDRAWPSPIWGTKSEKNFDLQRVNFWKQIFN